MARRLIGLDIGTNAVTVAEVTPGAVPRLERFGQVALARDAMREGEVADDSAVTEAIARLCETVDIKKATVRVGLASPRVIVRQIEMPVMSADELANALRFQATDLIPIPIDEAVLDFAILGNDTGDDGEPVMRVLLAAAQSAMVSRLVAAVENAGLSVAAVDLVPLALIRGLAQPADATTPVEGAEGIVSFGGGVTAIAVHENGVPKFVRALGTAGRELTDAIATDLDVPPDTAESLKRQLGASNDELVVRARQAIERPLATLLDEVRSSLDYYRNQPGAGRLAKVVVTGGGAQLPGMAERLSSLVGVPVELASPRAVISVGDIGFADEDLARLDPYLPAAVGLALGGAGYGTVIDLMPRIKRSRSHGGAAANKSRTVAIGVAAAAALLFVLGGATMLQRNELNSQKDKLAATEADNAELEKEIEELAPIAEQQAQVQAIDAQMTTLLATDVSWARMLRELGNTMPQGVWLKSFSAQATSNAPVVAAPASSSGSSSSASTSPPAPSTINGLVTIEATGVDYPDVSTWLRTYGDYPSFTNPWVSTVTQVTQEEAPVMDFSATATLTEKARSDRLDKFQEGSGK